MNEKDNTNMSGTASIIYLRMNEKDNTTIYNCTFNNNPLKQFDTELGRKK